MYYFYDADAHKGEVLRKTTREGVKEESKLLYERPIILKTEDGII